MNIFESVPPSTDVAKIQQQVISTRLFVCLFVICIVFLLTYLSVEMVTTTYTVISPSYNQFLTLYAKYSEHSLSCPCTSSITEYQYILQIDFKLHPLCYSDFVQFPWLSFPTLITVGFSYGGDMWSAAALFQILAAHCRLTASHIETNIQILNKTQMVTSQVLSELEFRARINATTNSFRTSITNSFLRSLSLITNTSRANGIVSAQATNFYPYVGGTTSLAISDNSSLLNFLYSHHVGCYCLPSVSCQNIILFDYDGYPNITEAIQFYSDCLPDEGIRQSSLRSLFDQILVNNLHAWFDFPLNTARILHINELIQFTTESLVKDILLNMMVNQWNVTSFHDVHFEKCRPQTCTYILVARRSFLIIFTTLIGLVGGLASILQTIVPFLIKAVFALHARYTREPLQEQAVEPVRFSMKSFMFNWLSKLYQLNLFPSLPPATNEPQIQTELISTRLYVLLIASSILILTIYSARIALEKSKTIVWPSLKEYRSLYDSHSDTLSCPCTSISIDHSAFLKLSPSFHQVCSSDLVTPHWIFGIIANQTYEFLYNFTSSTWYDFRLLGGSSFLTIALLCDVASTTVTDGLTSFGSSSLITSKVMSENELKAQGLALMDLFIVTITNEFINSLRTIRETSQANALISGHGTNVQMTWKIDERLPAAHYSTFLNCSCAISPLCSQEAGIYDANGVFQFPIPGVRIGCYVVEATLQSSLSAFYSQAYINDLRNWTKFIDPDFPVNALNSSLNWNFTTNTTIGYIMEQLMVDEWVSKNISFPDYYTQCQAYECKYTYIERNDIVYVISAGK